MQPNRLLAAAAFALAAVAPLAHAAPLNNSFGSAHFADTALSGTTAAARPELAGVVLEDVDKAFSVGGISGVVQNRVVREDATGTLDFYWRIMLDPTTTGNGVQALRLIDFGVDNLTDADYRIDGLGVVDPTIARLFNPSFYPSGALNFIFGDPVGNGDGSQFFFLHTGAHQYAETAAYDLLDASGTLSGIYSTFAPAVPEPSSTALFALGALTLFGLRRRAAASRA